MISLKLLEKTLITETTNEFLANDFAELYKYFGAVVLLYNLSIIITSIRIWYSNYLSLQANLIIAMTMGMAIP